MGQRGRHTGGDAEEEVSAAACGFAPSTRNAASGEFSAPVAATLASPYNRREFEAILSRRLSRMASKQRTFLGHPLGLYVFFFTEMWERFSYYGMRALLMIYMLNYFKFSQKFASTHYKVYTSFVYITPILGGYLADRYLGNRLAVIIGAILMAIGHFMMAFEDYPIFLAALVFLIIGNGFFKPNMSTQVGRLYPRNDGRRDGAYTIFYMGINLGAFLAPLICGWLQENTVGEYHSGFTAAGIGMLLGLVIYVVGQPLLKEIQPGSPEDVPVTTAAVTDPPAVAPPSEAEAERKASVLGGLSDAAPTGLTVLGFLLLTAAPVTIGLNYAKLPGGLAFFDAIMLAIAGGCSLLVAWVCKQVSGGARDRVLAILAVGVFVVFFWAAFEQAGNVLTVWADKSTDRNLSQPMTDPALFPSVASESDAPAKFGSFWERIGNMFNRKPKKEQSLTESVNPMPTAWFQSINAAAIVCFAPLFTILWMWLDKRGRQPSIPMKMTLGLLFVSASIAVMVVAANFENKETRVKLGAGPPKGVTFDPDSKKLAWVKTEKQGDNTFKEVGSQDFFAGRLRIDQTAGELILHGVLPDNERDLIVRSTSPEAFNVKLLELQKKSQEAGEKVAEAPVSVVLDAEPPGFDMRYASFRESQVSYDKATRTLKASMELADKDVLALRVAAGDKQWRDSINQLFLESNKLRVSIWWLFWSYILATFGELCLSPVGLSMVSKLSPARFATLLMGMWLLTSSFGNFAAGLFGELAETVPPMQLFIILTAVTAVAGATLYLLVRKITGMMHGVN